MLCTGGGIGDVLLATPCIRALRQRYTEVVALTAPSHLAVLAENSELSGVLVDDADFFTVRRRLAAASFDAAVVTWATLRSALLPFAAGIPVRVGQSRRLYSRLFTHRVTVRSELGDRATHWTQILLDYTRAIGCDLADATPTFVVPDDARVTARSLLRAKGITGPYGVFHPTRGIAAAARRRWPTPALATLARALRAAFGVPIIVTGSREDGEIAQAIAHSGGVVSVAGQTTIAEFGALAQDAEFVVAMDSGPMHLAAATGAATIGIFALRSDEPLRWSPLGPRVAIVRGTYPCPQWHRKETCPNFACISELPIDEVVQAVRVLRNASSQGGLGEAEGFAEQALHGRGPRDDSGAHR